MNEESGTKSERESLKINVTDEMKQSAKERERKILKVTLTDGERASIWGVRSITLDELSDIYVPYCFNPETNNAVLVFSGRRRYSSVLKALNNAHANNIRIIRSKEAISSFLGEVGEFKLVYEYGLTPQRLFGETSRSVEIARIISEFKFEALKDLNDYVLSERPDLFDELTRRYHYYTKIISNFKSIDQLSKIDETIKEGLSTISQAIQNRNDK